MPFLFSYNANSMQSILILFQINLIVFVLHYRSLAFNTTNSSNSKKKNNFLSRKTIRNYTSHSATSSPVSISSPLSLAESATCGNATKPFNFVANSLLLLQPAPPVALPKQQVADYYAKSANYYNPYHHHHHIHHPAYNYYQNHEEESSSQSNSMSTGHAASQGYMMSSEASAIMQAHDETANLRLLVEVAVGLWEEQQRNYEYRN